MPGADQPGRARGNSRVRTTFEIQEGQHELKGKQRRHPRTTRNEKKSIKNGEKFSKALTCRWKKKRAGSHYGWKREQQNGKKRGGRGLIVQASTDELGGRSESTL